MRLNLGAGVNSPEGIDLDIRSSSNPDIKADASILPFVDETFSEVEANQLLEHLSHEQIVRTLEEVHRVLEPNGIFRFMVPHGDSRLYKQDPTHNTSWTYRTLQYYFGGNFSYYTSDAKFSFEVLSQEIRIWVHPERPFSGIRTVLIRQIHNTIGSEDEYAFGGTRDASMEVVLKKRPLIN